MRAIAAHCSDYLPPNSSATREFLDKGDSGGLWNTRLWGLRVVICSDPFRPDRRFVEQYYGPHLHHKINADQSVSRVPDAFRIANKRKMTEVSQIELQINRLKARRATLLPGLVAASLEVLSNRHRRRLCDLIKTLQDDGDQVNVDLHWLPFIAPIPLPTTLAGPEPLPNDGTRFESDATAEEHDLLVRIIGAAEDGKSRFVRNSMFAYPAIVLAVSLIVLVLLCITVVPIFVSIFNDFGMVVPLVTSVVFSISSWLTSGFSVVVISLLITAFIGSVLVWLLRWCISKMGGADIFSKGRTSNLLAMSQITKRIAQSLETENVSDSLRWAALTCEYSQYRTHLEVLAMEAETRLVTLHQTSVAIRFPTNLISALQLCDCEGGTNSPQPAIALLQALSAIYEERALGRVAVGATLAGLLLTLIVSGIVAFLVLSLFMPLTNLVSALA